MRRRSSIALAMLGTGVLAIAGAAARADARRGWVEPAFAAVSHLCYEVSPIAALRRPTQVPLVRMHGTVLAVLVGLGLFAAPWVGAHGRRWWAVFAVGYAIRAAAWIVGGNLPLVPGDSCHYIEVASSVARGEGPVKHYVESFFADYPRIREGRGVLDDWATPLYAYALGGADRLAGVGPDSSLEAKVAVGKGLSFLFSLLAMPALYGLARRRFGREVGLGSVVVLAILPVHAIYAGFVLRESLVALTSILAVWAATEVWSVDGKSRWAFAVVAGICGGLAILARNTAMALVAATWLYGAVAHFRRAIGPLILGGVFVLATIAPWAWQTYREYGEPFYTYTNFFKYNFSWTVHHYDRGNTRPAEFFTRANAPEIARVKLKALLVMAGTSTMVLGLPLMAGLALRFSGRRDDGGEVVDQGRQYDRLLLFIVAAFVAGTLANVADVTQVAQLGRYFLPVFCLALPTAVAGLRAWCRSTGRPGRAAVGVAVAVLGATWADPTWAYDASWYVKPYQIHWAGLRGAGDWARSHPEAVPADSRVLTWFPWEFRVASDRTAILLPRSLYPPHVERTIRQYGVTHVLWGSFDPPTDVDPAPIGPQMDRLRLALGLTDDREVYRSPGGTPFPVRLYRLAGPGGPP